MYGDQKNSVFEPELAQMPQALLPSLHACSKYQQRILAGVSACRIL